MTFDDVELRAPSLQQQQENSLTELPKHLQNKRS